MGSRRVIMHIVAICLVLPLLVVSVEIDSKLDFGEDQHRSILEEPGVAILKNSDDIKVQCGNGGCNVTKNDTNTESISADVLVHIKTRVQLVNSTANPEISASSTPAPEDTPDVPVVVGYGGIPEDQRKAFDPLGPSEDRRYYNSNNNNPLTNEERKVSGVVGISSKEDDLNDVRYKENGIPLHSPYLAQNPPQRYVWYPRNSGVYGSYDNRRVWTVGPPQSRSQIQPGEEKTCICRKIGNQWYPIESIESRKLTNYHQPGPQINDKIEPLN